MLKKLFDVMLETLVLFLWLVLVVTVVTWIASGIVDASAGRAPAVLTVSAEARDLEQCLIPAGIPPVPKRTPQPAPEACTSKVCRRVKAWVVTPTPGAR